MASMQNFVCVCFYTRNYFIAQHSMHVTFANEEQFTYEYEQVKWDSNSTVVMLILSE